ERVFWIVDNSSSHRGQASMQRLEGNYANLRLVHLPVHASWLNQIEIDFSIVQRKGLIPNDLTDLAEVEQRLLGFQRRYEQTAVPFAWRYTRADLDRLIRRLDEPAQPINAADHRAGGSISSRRLQTAQPQVRPGGSGRTSPRVPEAARDGGQGERLA